MKNIIISSRELTGYNVSGGIGVYTDAVARHLVRHGHKVQVITAAKFLPDSPEIALPPERPYQIIPIRPVEGFRTAAHGHAYAVYRQLKAMVAKEPIDIVEFPDYHGEGYYTIKAKRLLGEFAETTLLVHGHMTLEFCDILNEENLSLQRQAIYNIEQYCLRYADVVTVPCEDLGQQYQQFVPRDYELKRHPVPVFDTPRLEPISSSTPRVLYVGRLEHRKGVDLLIQSALAVLESGRQMTVRLIGGDTTWHDQSYRAYLMGMIPQKWQDHFEFVGPVSRAHLVTEYQTADVVVFPSRFENWPNVCLEAMSLAKPIIASQYGGMREMLAQGAGLVIDPLDMNAFSEALMSLLDDPAQRLALGQRARDAYARWADARTVGNVEDFIRALDSTGDGSSSSQPDPLVSIVVPCYNAAATIKETVDSLLAQQYPHFEIILVDDGSTDQEFAQMLDQLGQAHDQVRVFHKENSGLPGARNYGAKKAQGQLLAFCDADDLLDPATLHHSVQALQKNPELTVVYPIIEYFEGAAGYWAPQDLYAPTLLAQNQAHAGIVIRRNRFFALGGYDEAFKYGWEDWEFLLRLAKAGDRGEVVPYPHYHYRVRADSMVRTTSQIHRRKIQRQMWTKHQDVLGPAAYFVLEKEVLQYRDMGGGNGAQESHREWIRRITLNSKPVRLIVFLSRGVPGFIRRPVRRWAKRVLLRRLDLQ